MAGWTRVLGWVRAVSRRSAVRGAFLLGASSIAGCVAIGRTSSPDPIAIGPSIAGGSSTAFAGFGGTEVSCVPPVVTAPTFAAQVVTSQSLFTRELYSWTTDEQAAQLRKDKILFSQAAGSGAPFTILSNVTNVAGDPLAQVLSSAFQMGRYAWPEPWATRMGWPGQDPGGQLVRIVLKPEAWLAVAQGATLTVFDGQEQSVAEVDALAHPERVGAIYFDTSAQTPRGCGSAGGFREFLVGNLGMVQEWSIGTQQIADRVASNVVQLTQFLNNIRSCPNTGDPSNWAVTALCAWGVPQDEISSGAAGEGGVDTPVDEVKPVPLGPAPATGSEELAYDQALALPNANYFAVPAQIEAIIETLQGDPIKLDPLVVTPGSP